MCTCDALLTCVHQVQAPLEVGSETKFLSFNISFDLINHKALLFKRLTVAILLYFCQPCTNTFPLTHIFVALHKSVWRSSGQRFQSTFLFSNLMMWHDISYHLMVYADDTSLFCLIPDPPAFMKELMLLNKDFGCPVIGIFLTKRLLSMTFLCMCCNGMLQY